jgi:hypothetical protein
MSCIYVFSKSFGAPLNPLKIYTWRSFEKGLRELQVNESAEE